MGGEDEALLRPTGKLKPLVLTPYLLKATSTVTAAKLVEAFNRLYPDWDPVEDENDPVVVRWLAKMRIEPGSSLSTGRTNSFRGVLTCSLLDVLGAPWPKKARTRQELAWTIFDSPVGKAQIGSVPEFEETLLAYRPQWLDARDA